MRARPDGWGVEPWADDAVAWSLLGAVVAALEEQQVDAADELPLGELAVGLHALAGFIDDDSLSGWNDAPGRARAEVDAAPAAAAEEAARLPSPPPVSYN